MGRKSRLKWERRERDGWPFRGGAADVWRLMAESARHRPERIAALGRIIDGGFIDEASYVTPEAMAEACVPIRKEPSNG